MGSNIGCDRQEKDFHDIHCCLSAAIPGSSDSSADRGDLRIGDTLIRILVCAFKKFIALNLRYYCEYFLCGKKQREHDDGSVHDGWCLRHPTSL